MNELDECFYCGGGLLASNETENWVECSKCEWSAFDHTIWNWIQFQMRWSKLGMKIEQYITEVKCK